MPAGIFADAQCFKSQGDGSARERERERFHCGYPWKQQQRLCFEVAAFPPIEALLVKGELLRLAGY